MKKDTVQITVSVTLTIEEALQIKEFFTENPYSRSAIIRSYLVALSRGLTKPIIPRLNRGTAPEIVQDTDFISPDFTDSDFNEDII